MLNYKHQIFIQTKYFAETNTRHYPMVKAIDTSSGESVIIFWNYNISKLENHLKAAEALYLKLKMNISNIYYSENKKHKGHVITAS